MQLLFAHLTDSAQPKDDGELKGTAGERENILTEPSSMIIIFPTDYFPFLQMQLLQCTKVNRLLP